MDVVESKTYSGFESFSGDGIEIAAGAIRSGNYETVTD